MGIDGVVCSRASSLILCVSLLAAGCSQSGAEGSHGESSEPPVDRVSRSGVASPSDNSSAAGDSLPTANLKCSQFISEGEPPDESLRTVADVVALPAFEDFGTLAADDSMSGTDSTSGAAEKKYFAKEPLVIRTNRSFDLTVSAKDRATVAIGWGNATTDLSSRVHVSCDHAAGEWMTFAGGYFADRQSCATLIVTVDGDEREHEVRVGIGTDC